MKRILCLLLVLCMMLPVIALAEEAPAAKLGTAYGFCHNHGVTVASVVVVDGVIVDASIDEIYFTNANGEFKPLAGAEEVALVTDGETENTIILLSKRENDDLYSANMVKAGKQTVATSYDAIEAFVIGKTVTELEEIVAQYDPENTDAEAANSKVAFIDVVSGATLTDTLKYTLVLLDAAHAAQ